MNFMKLKSIKCSSVRVLGFTLSVFLLSVSFPPSQSCFKRVRDWHSQFFKNEEEERAAELYIATFPHYAKNSVSDFFIEVEQDDNGDYQVVETNELPPILNEKFNETVNITGTFNTSQGSGTTETILTTDDYLVQQEWGGTCISEHWHRCSRILRILAPYVEPKDKKKQVRYLEIDCLEEPILCLRNGWTVNRCHLICMSKCNSVMLYDWDKIVSYTGPCKYGLWI